MAFDGWETLETGPPPDPGPGGGAGSDDGLVAGMVLAEEGLGTVLHAALWTQSDDDLLGELGRLYRLEAQVAAARHRLLMEAEARGLAKLRGAGTLAELVRTTLAVTLAEARNELSLARATRTGPCTATGVALAEGACSVAKARVICETLRSLPRDTAPMVCSRVEGQLLEQARFVDKPTLVKSAARLREELATPAESPNGGEANTTNTGRPDADKPGAGKPGAGKPGASRGGADRAGANAGAGESGAGQAGAGEAGPGDGGADGNATNGSDDSSTNACSDGRDGSDGSAGSDGSDSSRGLAGSADAGGGGDTGGGAAGGGAPGCESAGASGAGCGCADRDHAAARHRALDPQPGDPDPAAVRRLTFSDTLQGTTLIFGELDAEGAAMLRSALDSLSAPSAARDGVRDPRSAARRRADALIEAFRRLLTAAVVPSSGGVRPDLSVIVPWEVLHHGGKGVALTSWGQPLPRSTLARLCCDASLSRVIVDPGGVPLDVGRATRTATPAIRRALALRDRGCAWPGCDRPPSWCEAHHAVGWLQGGATALDNMLLLCPLHHHRVHTEGWTITFGADRRPTFLPPSRIDPTRTPRRNPYSQPVLDHPTRDHLVSADGTWSGDIGGG